jgi:hypothetical protein
MKKLNLCKKNPANAGGWQFNMSAHEASENTEATGR